MNRGAAAIDSKYTFLVDTHQKSLKKGDKSDNIPSTLTDKQKKTKRNETHQKYEPENEHTMGVLRIMS